MKWWRMVDRGPIDWKADSEDGPFIGHIYSEVLYPELLDNLKARGLDKHTYQNEVVTEAGFDLPGIAHMKRHWCEIALDGLKVLIPATDLEFFHGHWSEEGQRLELSKLYYKLKAHQRCLCVTPGQRQDLLAQMGEQLQEATAIASAENERFNHDLVGVPGLMVAPRPTKAPEGES